MENGRIRQVGKPLEVYRAPRSRFVAEFLGETNLISGSGDGTGVVTEVGWIDTGARVGGGEVHLSIRPEAWRLETRRSGASSIPGRIVETVYLGEMARHRFATESGRELVVFELNPHPRKDGQLYLTVEPGDVAVLGAEEA
jgi:ABC-type Fe3+/spermidine/putrescine transport system ATPase subunit